MSHRFAVTAVLSAILLAGCRALAPGASGPASDEEPTPVPVAATAAPTPVEATPTASQCSLGVGIADQRYGGIQELAAFSDGVAVAQVTRVGDLQYSTESGDRPSCEYLAAAQSVFGVGRMLELRIQTPVAGAASRGQIVRYMFPGGTIGQDTSPGHHYGLTLPAVGDRVLVLLTDPPIDVDGGSGELTVDVVEMFAITSRGEVVTPNRDERLTVERVRELVRNVLPPASPGE